MLNDAQSACCLKWWDTEEMQDSFEVNLCINTLVEARGHLYSTGRVCGWIMCVNVYQTSAACCYLQDECTRVTSTTLNQWITQTFLFKIPPTYHKSWKSLTAFLRTPAVFQWYLSGRGVFCVLFLKITYSTFDFLFSMLTVLFSLYVLYCTVDEE